MYIIRILRITMVHVRNKKLLHPELCYTLNGIFFKVHNELGRFKNEKQYGDAVEDLLKEKGIVYIREFRLPKSFPAEFAGRNIVDFLVEKTVVVEIKTKIRLGGEEYYQVRRYLDALGCELGILVNFRRYSIVPKRILNTKLHSEYSDN